MYIGSRPNGTPVPDAAASAFGEVITIELIQRRNGG